MIRQVSKRRHARPETDLDITPVMNLFMVLIPFLLLTAVFAKTAVIDIYLPQASSEPSSQPSAPTEILSITLTDEGFKFGGLGKGIAAVPKKDGQYDFDTLASRLLELKDKHPEKSEVVLLFPQNAPYELVIKLMDSSRETYVSAGDKRSRRELFPLVSVGEDNVKGGS